MNFLAILLPIYLSLASHFHGGAFISAPRWLRNAVFALPYALFFHSSITMISWQGSMVSAETCEFISGFISFAFAYIGVNIGHNNFWMMGTTANSTTNDWLADIVQFLGVERDSLLWCTLGLGIKGFIMGLGTLNPFVILGHTIAFPLGYYIGDRTKWNTNASEYLTGLFDGLTLMLVFLLSQ
jgi:hypothetical protein